MFPFLCDWAAPIRLTVRWQTTIQDGLDNSEERALLSAQEVIRLEFSLTLLTAAQVEILDHYLTLIGPTLVECPVWPWQLETISPALAGTREMVLPDTARLAAGDKLWCYDVTAPAPFPFYVRVAEVLSPTLLELIDPPAQTLPAGAVILPVRTGHLTQRGDVTRLTDEAGSCKLVFEEEPGYRPAVPVPVARQTFQGRPLFHFVPDWAQPPTTGWMDDVAYERIGFGASSAWRTSPYPKRLISAQFTLLDAAEAGQFQDLLLALRGRFSGFWVSSFGNDFPLLTDLPPGETVAQVEDVAVAIWQAAVPQARTAVFQPADGTCLPCTITGTTTQAGENRLQLQFESAPRETIRARETMLSRLYYARLVEDEVTLEFTTPLLARAALKFVELPQETAAQEAGESPLWLYRITQGETALYWTSCGQPITAGGQTWQPMNLNHTGIKRSADFFDDGVRLEMATTDPAHFFRQWLAVAPPQVTQISIYATTAPALALDLNQPLYAGEVGQVSFAENGKITVELTSVLRIGETQVPTVLLGSRCNWRFGDAATCGLDLGPFTVHDTLASVAPASVTVPACAQAPSGRYTHGVVTCQGIPRLIRQQDGATLYLAAPFPPGVAAGTPATVTPGCDRAFATCQAYGNQDRFGGFPWIPTYNPKIWVPPPSQQFLGEASK